MKFSNIGLIFAISLMIGNQAVADRLVCSLTSPPGKPSLMGRAAISAREYVYPATGEVASEFRYTQFPTKLNQSGNNVLLETDRLLTISGDMHYAKLLLSQNNKYHDELFGDKAPISHADFDKLLVCNQPTLSDATDELDRYYKAVFSKLNATQAKQLQDTYVLWAKTRDMTCALETMFSGRSKNSDDYMATCLIRITEDFSKTLRTIYASVNPATTD